MSELAFKISGLMLASPPPPPPPPTVEEIAQTVAAMALKAAEPEMQVLVGKLLLAERLAAGWRDKCATASELLKSASAAELDLVIATFVTFGAEADRDFGPWLKRCDEELAKLPSQPPALRASLGEVWRRYRMALLTVFDQVAAVIRAAGAEKAMRFPTQAAGQAVASSGSQAALNLKAAKVYKVFADSEFGVNCEILAEEFGEDEVFVVAVPTPQGVEKPHRRFADKEERILEAVEGIYPELLGRSYIRYVGSADAA